MQKIIVALCFSLIYTFLYITEVLAENKNLFKIERNKNANVVMYDARLDLNGNINKKNPVDAYWILYAKQGQREEITAFEKKAYGYTVTANDDDDNSYNLVLKAVKDRPMKIVLVNGEYKAEILINNEKAYLSSVYVSASDALIPKVSYIILTGTKINTGEKVTEKIIETK
ncbi:DUF4833 domain-containing protein [Candidatus Endomicrobiellum devescovinae]|jgi:hypothetical protein|uniref:DUF4833 domain-containing protein n=1 Tax=Candidatus Endomicrobiellum devescovinae TaxID=3242322 RepID=UPI00281C38BD|nr:DUF4833 domain-containing protein [Endomicrobium sp.]